MSPCPRASSRVHRALIVEEAFRVTNPRGVVCVGAPAGENARELEWRLNDLFRSRNGHGHPWLREHLKNEVVHAEELRAYIEQGAARYMGRYELHLTHDVGLRFWFTRATWSLPMLMQFQRILLGPFSRQFLRFDGPPSYRPIAVAEGLAS